jgi:type IV secretion system protein VirB6
MSNVNFDGTLNFAGTLGGCVILSIACILIVIQLPSIAAGLANGVGVGLWHELRIAAGIGSKSVGAARATAGGAAAGGRAAYSGGKAAVGAIGRAVGRFRGSGRAAA